MRQRMSEVVRLYAMSLWAFELPKNKPDHLAGFVLARDELEAQDSANERLYELYPKGRYSGQSAKVIGFTDAIQHDVPRLLQNGGVLA